MAGNPERTTYHHGNLPVALVEAALQLLEEGGVEALTLRAAARRAGVSPAAPYRHYQDKNELLAAVAREGFEELVTRLSDAAERHKADPVESIGAQGGAYIRFALEKQAHFRVMFGPEVSNHANYPALRESSSQAFSSLTGAIEAGQAAGTIREGVVKELTSVTWATVHGLADLALSGQLDEDAGGVEHVLEFALRAKELIYHGLRP